jgi:hypothetical protein
MALTRVGTVTRQIGSFGTPGLFVAYKRDAPGAPENRVGFFPTPSLAQGAVDRLMGGQMVRWKREDMPGNIEAYVGYLDL